MEEKKDKPEDVIVYASGWVWQRDGRVREATAEELKRFNGVF